MKSWFIGKDPDAGKNWGQEEKEMTEDEMVRQHHQLNGHEFEQTLGDSKGQGSLLCCSPWGCQESDTTEQLKDTNGLAKSTMPLWRLPYLFSGQLIHFKECNLTSPHNDLFPLASYYSLYLADSYCLLVLSCVSWVSLGTFPAITQMRRLYSTVPISYFCTPTQT